MKLMRCWFMVCDMHQGLCPHPCSCRSPSGLPHLPPSRPTQLSLQPVKLIQKSASLHPPVILPCLSHLAPLPHGWIQNPVAGVHGCGGIHPPIFPGKGPDIHASPSYEICQLSAAWLSFSSFQSGHRSTLNPTIVE